MLNGSNAALLMKANGEPEIIQFRDVVLNPDGSYTLRGLLRGRCRTDVHVDGHAVGFGTLFENAETRTQSHTGRDLKPYAPWNVQAALTGSPADITLSWLRRTRIGGELKDGTGLVPLGEASEAYEVDILDAPGGAVLRTLALTSPSLVYANADISPISAACRAFSRSPSIS